MFCTVGEGRANQPDPYPEEKGLSNPAREQDTHPVHPQTSSPSFSLEWLHTGERFPGGLLAVITSAMAWIALTLVTQGLLLYPPSRVEDQHALSQWS